MIIPPPFMRGIDFGLLSLVFTFSVYVTCLLFSNGSGCWCSNTAAAWTVESCEVCNDRQTEAYFSEQETLKWAAVLHDPHLCPN